MATGKRGVPLALLAFMLSAWVGARAVIWDNPIANSPPALASNERVHDLGDTDLTPVSATGRSYPAPQSFAYSRPLGGPYPYGAPYPYGYLPYGHAPNMTSKGLPGHGVVPTRVVYYPVYADAPDARPAHLRGAAQLGGGSFARAPQQAPGAGRYFANSYLFDDISGFAGQDLRRTGQVSRPGNGAGLPVGEPPKTDRWMLDMFGFYRQGSSALSIPQGRSPIYGASQLSANLQWRAKPSSSHDPRIFLRAYQAQVEGGESEIAAGLSARPLGKVPVRLFGEVRATQSPAVSDLGVGVQTKFRPAAYAATELAPIKLPMGFALETYGAAGYVAGSPSTYFLDGQVVATRELLRLGKPGAGGAVSLGAGVWGGAQRDAKRLDVGPTLRFDVDIGKMPARVSVDYREQVAGDAEPDSGVAATVSTRF